MNKPPSARIYATIYACSERSIRNYRAENAPLDNPAAMFAWWASRKNLPRGAAEKGLEAVREAFAAVTGAAAIPPRAPTPVDDLPPVSPMQDELPAGAEHELRWLAGLAVEARRNLIRAQKSDNPVTQKQALDSYLKITEGLRKFDNQVDLNRRDGGEVITRGQLAPTLTTVTVWLRRGVEDFINSVCLQIAEADSPEKVYATIAPQLRQSLGNAVSAATNDGKLPAWVRDAMVEGL